MERVWAVQSKAKNDYSDYLKCRSRCSRLSTAAAVAPA